jgi:predicted dehydrogenase
MRNFLDAVAGNCQPSVTLADGLKAARLALAVLKSAEVNEPVTF